MNELPSTNKLLADLLFPNNQLTPEWIESYYPARPLPDSAMVTRIAPSPTGPMHIGGVYAALISERLAHQSGGVFYLRIEDTDQRREFEGARELIVASLDNYGIKTDEGETLSGDEIGEYGPYSQSERREIYHAYAKFLVEKGLAYPCFCTPDELEQIRTQQAEKKIQTGYYGEWAKWRDADIEEVRSQIQEGREYVIRLKSPEHHVGNIHIRDTIKGEIAMPDNNQDLVLLKSDGLPTYHFAHVVDDHLMGTTHVIRGDEWLPSTSVHLQLFNILGWKAPIYGHISPIVKNEPTEGGGMNRRKLSKRKDPEASVLFYTQQGFPPEAVIDYLLNLANSDYEEWRGKNPYEDSRNFQLDMAKLRNSGGALLDLTKIEDISKNYIASLDAQEVYERTLSWATLFDGSFAQVLRNNYEYAINILGIDRGNPKTQRKDIALWNDTKKFVGYFFDEIFDQSIVDLNQLQELEVEEIARIADAIANSYEEYPSQESWLSYMRKVAIELGYAPDGRTFKASPESYLGEFGTIAKVVRVLLSGRNQTPNLFEVMSVMGPERVKKRLTVFNN